MKLNSPQSIKTAKKVFSTYGSWSAAREASTGRDRDGVLVIPKGQRDGETGRFSQAGAQAKRKPA